jgi:hypothetical protein
MSFLTGLLKYEPVLLAWVLNGGLAVLLGTVVHVSTTQEAAVTTIATGLVAIYTWFATKDKAVSVLVGFISTVAVAGSAFGLHLSSAEIGAGAAILSGILALVFRQNATPAAARPAAQPVKFG